MVKYSGEYIISLTEKYNNPEFVNMSDPLGINIRDLAELAV